MFLLYFLCILGWAISTVLTIYLIRLHYINKNQLDLQFVDNIFIDVFNCSGGRYCGAICTLDNYGNKVIIQEDNMSHCSPLDAKRAILCDFERICNVFGFDKNTGNKI